MRAEGWFVKLSSLSALLRDSVARDRARERGFSNRGDDGGSRGVGSRTSVGFGVERAQARVPRGERRVALEGEGRAHRIDFE